MTSRWPKPTTTIQPTQRLHVAFAAPNHEQVDAFWQAGVDAGHPDDGAPGPRPQYLEDYYGAFLRDPDGNSVEAVHYGGMRREGIIDHLRIRVADLPAATAFYTTVAATAGCMVRHARRGPHDRHRRRRRLVLARAGRGDREPAHGLRRRRGRGRPLPTPRRSPPATAPTASRASARTYSPRLLRRLRARSRRQQHRGRRPPSQLNDDGLRICQAVGRLPDPLPFDPIAEAERQRRRRTGQRRRRRWLRRHVDHARSTSFVDGPAQRRAQAVGVDLPALRSADAAVLQPDRLRRRWARWARGRGVHPTSVTNLIDGLEKLGYVTRAAHPSDRRTTLAMISDRGREVAQAATTALSAMRFGTGEMLAHGPRHGHRRPAPDAPRTRAITSNSPSRGRPQRRRARSHRSRGRSCGRGGRRRPSASTAAAARTPGA